MGKPPFLCLKITIFNITGNEKSKIKNMYINFKCESIYKRNFEGVSEIVRKIRTREHVQNRIVLLYEGQT